MGPAPLVQGGLPSERYAQGDPRPLGFLYEAPPEHIQRAAEELTRLCGLFDDPPPTGRPLEICFCHMRHTVEITPALFGFALWDIDSESRFRYPLEEGREVRYVLMVNLPVELQLESALLFVLQILYRQDVVVRAREHDDITTIDEGTQQADEQALRELSDRLRYGLADAAQMIARKARDREFWLSLRYEPDPLPRREEIVSRMSVLRKAYNELQLVRETVDKVVSAIGGHAPMLRSAGAPTAMRDLVQQQLALVDFLRYTNHCTRDSEVLGNGYLVTDRVNRGAFNLLPETVEILSDGGYRAKVDGSVRVFSVEEVLHVRGIEQIESPYGISMIEVFVPYLDQISTFQNAKKAYGYILERAGLGSNERDRAERGIDLADRSLAAITGRIERILWFPHEHMAPPVAGLYLPGHELFNT